MWMDIILGGNDYDKAPLMAPRHLTQDTDVPLESSPTPASVTPTSNKKRKSTTVGGGEKITTVKKTRKEEKGPEVVSQLTHTL